jgi:proteasome lid subunit RPN8/RPN11
MDRFTLARSHLAQIERETRAANLRECCGLIEGIRDGESLRAIALHPTRNLSSAYDAFEIDPAEQFRLLRALRGRDRALIGCYHSHPGGAPEPSARDRRAAAEEGFVWLIASVQGGRTELGAWLWQALDFRPLAIIYDG